MAAASEAFVAHGFRGTTLSMIAAACELPVEAVVSVGAKADLALAAYRREEMLITDWSAVVSTPELRRVIDESDNARALHDLITHLAGTVDTRHRLWLAAKAAAAQEQRHAVELAQIFSIRRQSHQLFASIVIARGMVPLNTDREKLARQIGTIISMENYSYLVDVWKIDRSGYRDYLWESLSSIAASSRMSSLGFSVGAAS